MEVEAFSLDGYLPHAGGAEGDSRAAPDGQARPAQKVPPAPVNAALEQKLAELPTTPGVYLMKGRTGEIIYVGKAVNLRSRVRSYFSRASSDTRAAHGTERRR